MSNPIVYAFNVEGIPAAQPRVKAYVRGKHAAVYTPKTANSWKDCVKCAGILARPKSPLQGPLFVSMTFAMPRPKAHYRSGKYSGELRLTAPGHVTAKPDFDNLMKSTVDALTEIGFWRDDSQLAQVQFKKMYCSPDERPGCSITIVLLLDLET